MGIAYSGLSFFTNSSASSKWVYNAAGTLVNVAAGSLAVDYDPVTHAPRGLLVEPAATNILIGSNDLSIMNTTAGTATVNNQAGPDAAMTADTFTEDTTVDTHGAYGAAAGPTTANGDYTISRFIKMGTRRYATVSWADGTNGAYGVYDLQSGVVGSSAAFGTGVLNSASIQALPNGWYRCILSARVNATTMYFTFGTANAATVTADTYGRQSFLGTGATLFFGHGQIEAGTVATSPIPTPGGTVTRAADQVSIAPASINYSSTAGSWWAEWSVPAIVVNGRIIGNTSASAPLLMGTNSVGILDGTTLSKSLTWAVNATHKAASAYAAGDRAVTINGATVAADAGVVTNLLAPGAAIYFGNGGSTPMNGYLRKVRYLPRRPTNAELVTMTT
jgi:hypothetical protein